MGCRDAVRLWNLANNVQTGGWNFFWSKASGENEHPKAAACHRHAQRLLVLGGAGGKSRAACDAWSWERSQSRGSDERTRCRAECELAGILEYCRRGDVGGAIGLAGSRSQGRRWWQEAGGRRAVTWAGFVYGTLSQGADTGTIPASRRHVMARRGRLRCYILCTVTVDSGHSLLCTV